MYKCEPTYNGIKATCSYDEYNAIFNSLFKLKEIAKTKILIQKIDDLIVCFNKHEFINNTDIELSLTYAELADLISLLAYFVTQ